MRFLNALAWFSVTYSVTRFAIVSWQHHKTKNLIHYMLLEPRVHAAQARCFLVLCIAVLWLIFGG